MLIFRGLLQLAIALTVFGTPTDGTQTLRKRQTAVSIVKGVGSRDEHGNVHLRREVSDLKENFPKQWNLYLLGLTALQAADQGEPLSFYDLATIHGMPYRTWGNAHGLPHKEGHAGYCPHNNLLFLGWHRPYLALYEEVLYKHIQDIASKAPEGQRANYTAAAKSFRLPYWDWARGEATGSVPSFFLTRNIAVIHPDGSEDSIWNPLYSYRFHPLIPADFDGKWRGIEATIRWPETDSTDAPSRQERFVEEFESQKRSLRDHVDMAFRSSKINKFAYIIEEAHGWVHGVIGGGWDDRSKKGHFWPLEYSAYEPLFMLHHVNIDRLYAMYQAAHPDHHFRPQNISENGNYFLEDGQTVDADTELLPFRKNVDAFWTTEDARHTETLGYAYPETQSNEHTAKAIAKLYSHSAKDALMAEQSDSKGHVAVAKDGTYTDWAISLKAITSQLPSSFIVRFSFATRTTAGGSKDVGTWMRLMPSNHGGNMQIEKRADNAMIAESRMSITSELLDLVDAGELLSLHVEDVVPYLKERLAWKATTADGAKLPSTSLNAFTFEVVSTKARIPNSLDEGIEYSQDIVKHPEVTMGKARGVAA